MQFDDVPGWCRQGLGPAPVLIVAPHGGRRPPAAAPHDPAAKVNDLHTAAVAAELAAALGASFVINGACDRNQLDLNRISQVRARAPWFLRLLDALLGEALRRHDRVELLVVHGWNTSQPKCDLGIGRRLELAADAAAHAAELTVSPAYAAERLVALRAACGRRGIEAPFGERYPARHPNNVLQLFRRAPRPQPAAPRLAAWAAAGRIEAVQLELGVPLRWPGAVRSAFLAAMQQTFLGAADARVANRDSESAPHRATRPERLHAVVDTTDRRDRADPPAAHAPGQPLTAALQCYDPDAQIGVVARVDQNPAGGLGARLLLFAGPRRVGLFTGEERGGTRLGGGGPHLEHEPDGFRLHFDGHLLVTDDGARYVDLEDAFAASTLNPLRLQLRFRSGGAPDLGTVSGTVELDGALHTVRTAGVARPALQQRAGGAWSSQVHLTAVFGPEHGLRIQHEFPGRGLRAEELTASGHFTRAVAAAAVYFDGRSSAPTRLALAGIVAEPIAHLAIVRSVGGERRARVSFGIARIRDGAARGYGFFEYARVL